MNLNVIHEVRPGSTFGTFEIYDDSQLEVLNGFKRLADSILMQDEKFKSNQCPFDNGRLIILHGKTGVGKTHLVEAFINYIRENSIDIFSQIFLSRSNFTHDNMTFANEYGSKPIIIIDDIFSEHQSTSGFHPRTEIASIMNFVQMVYDRRCLVIITSNFPFKGQIVKMINNVDQVGRVTSRLKELMASSGEIELIGKDYREVLAEQRSGDIFSMP